MPALLTHDFFGKDVYAASSRTVGLLPQEKQAFLLGNQGPDPLFYLFLAPGTHSYRDLGNLIHNSKPIDLFVALKHSLDGLRDDEVYTGRAYADGFLCHYLLDCTEHPLIFSQEYAICDAGVEGLTRADGSEVHAEIERELDEVTLFTKAGTTVATYRPFEQVLQCDDQTLEIIGRMYAFVVRETYGRDIPNDLFPVAVHSARFGQRALYSPDGRKSEAMGIVERGMGHRRYSIAHAMAHRDRASLTSDFDNHLQRPWVNPYTLETHHDSFWDLYYKAQHKAEPALKAFNAPDFDRGTAVRITGGCNFSGEQVQTV
jgi:hypothetical protein